MCVQIADEIKIRKLHNKLKRHKMLVTKWKILA